MHAVVRRYMGASQLFDELERRSNDVEQLMRGVPGFVSYCLIRSGDGGCSVTVCQDRQGTEESTRVASDWIRQNLSGMAGSAPEVMEGNVILKADAMARTGM
jgi:hypothetical protein